MPPAPRAPYGGRASAGPPGRAGSSGPSGPRAGYSEESLRGFSVGGVGGVGGKRPYGGDLRDGGVGGPRDNKRPRGPAPSPAPAAGGRPERGAHGAGDRGAQQQQHQQQQGKTGAQGVARPDPAKAALLEPVSEQEVQRVRMLVVEQMQALLEGCKEKGETPSADVHGFLLSRWGAGAWEQHALQDYKARAQYACADICMVIQHDPWPSGACKPRRNGRPMDARASEGPLTLLPTPGRDGRPVDFHALQSSMHVLL